MADTYHEYNHTKSKLLGLGVTPQASNFYLELLSSSASFDATHTTKAAVDNSGSYEVYGNGWTQGGENLASVAVSIVETSKAMLDAADVDVEATGGAIGPASFALVWLDEGGAGTTKTPLWLYEFDDPITAAQGDFFLHRWSASGILRVG